MAQQMGNFRLVWLKEEEAYVLWRLLDLGIVLTFQVPGFSPLTLNSIIDLSGFASLGFGPYVVQ